MDRRKFLGVLGGAVAAVAAGVRIPAAKPVPINLLAEAYRKLEFKPPLPGPFIVSTPDGGSYAQAKLLQSILNRRNEAFREMADKMEALYWG